ncbi:uncharacterized protein K02A2.6-like [Uloborus diversus]|uniref:uncharacterized protein K02A2.6-like n=1 Tax=Uloborus diversus TaxID=327109 RepID=UPI00240A9295|nr:uncharacterized protein K02A2.6-like [Uloborus diversus]
MEVDSGAKVTIIDSFTFKELFPTNPPRLENCPYIIRDYNKNAVKILGQCDVDVHYSSFKGKLPILIAKEPRESLLGTNWFEPLGTCLTGVHRISNLTLDSVVEEFSDVFKDELGTYKGAPITLKLDPTFRPIQLKARTVPYALKQKIEKELQRLQEQGAIEPVDYAEWTTPVVPILKSNGEIRLCGDYKCTLNRALGQYPYPVPAVSQVLAELAGSRYFIKLDLSQAYLQLTVDEDSAMAQTIVTHKGAFKCKRLQFGISSAPGIFQQFIERLLSSIPGVLPYFDDVLIKGSTMEELTERFRQVLKKFSESGLRLNKEMCIIGASSIQYLGFHIDKDGIKPTKDKVDAIRNAPTPKSKEELQAFLGLLNFYHVFLKNKADIAEPLHRLLDKDAHWTWTNTHQSAFEKVKRLLSAETLLTHFDEKKPIILTCDTSQFGIGAVLSHQLEDGTEAPIAYYSRTMNKTEHRYAQIDKEALAIIQGVKKFYNFLFGQKFEIRSDHKPLLGLLAPNKPIPSMLSPRMQRWSIMLSSYDYNLVYKPGKEITNADGLSRLPQPMSPNEENSPMEILLLEALKKPLLKCADLARLTALDPILSRVLNWTWRGWPKQNPDKVFEPFYTRKLELSVHKGCLLWGARVIIPKKAQADLLGILHNTHQGIVKTKALARSYVWWPGIDKDVEKVVNSCETCQQTRNVPPKTVIPWENTKTPWARIHIDHAGPFQNSLFLIVVDSFSKWLEVVRVPSTESAATINALRKLFATHGIPNILVSDNGPSFTSEAFQDFLVRNGIKFVPTAPHHPSSNGQAERMLQTTKNALKRIITGNWEYRLAAFLLSQHATPNSTTGVSPAELLMNRRLKTCLDKLHPDLSEAINTKQERDNLNNRTRVKMFAPLEAVYALGFPPHRKWVPATITEVLGMTTYLVQTDEGMVWRRHDQLRSRIVPTSQSDISDNSDEIYSDILQRSPVRAQSSGSSQDSPTLSDDLPLVGDVDNGPVQSSTNDDPGAVTVSGPSPGPQSQRPVRNRHPPEWFKDYKT